VANSANATAQFSCTSVFSRSSQELLSCNLDFTMQQTTSPFSLTQKPANIYLVTLVWPWPWPHDLGTWPWPRYSEDVLA